MNKYHNAHKGQKCVIACNGPSLNDIDMDLIGRSVSQKNLTVFSLNRGYLKKDLMFRYLVVVNKNVEEQWGKEILERLPKDKIFSNSIPGTNLLKWTADKPSFQADINKPMWQGHTVTYVALQIAYYMGFSEVGIIGCDHDFPYMRTKLTGDDINHFDPNYFPAGAKWDLPNLAKSEIAYELARRAYSKDKRKIYNCSTRTKLNVFSKTTLEEFLK